MPQEELRARPCSCPQRHRGGSSSSLRRSMPQQKWPQRPEGSRRRHCSLLRRSSSSSLHSMPQRERARSSWPQELWPRSLPHGRRPCLSAHSCGGGGSLLPLPNAGTQEWARPLPLAEEAAVAESPPPLPPALQCRTAAEAAKQSPMPLSQLQWPTAGEASAPAAAASATGQRDKKNKQQRRVEADRPESPERPPRHVEDAVRPESPQRLQQVVRQLSDENLNLRRRIFELEAELMLLLRPQPQTTQRLERQDC